MLKLTLTVAAMMSIFLFASEKYYLTPDQIAISEETIYVQLDDALVEVDTLLVDQGGLYMSDNNIRCAQCHRSLLVETPCHKRLNPKNTCHKRLNPKNTCSVT